MPGVGFEDLPENWQRSFRSADVPALAARALDPGSEVQGLVSFLWLIYTSVSTYMLLTIYINMYIHIDIYINIYKHIYIYIFRV